MLLKEIQVGESLKIGDALITLVKKSGQSARLCIDAPAHVRVEQVTTRKPQPEKAK